LQPGLKTPDPFLDADAIRAATSVRFVEVHDTLGSTNDRAAELARDAQIELPALIAARIQTAGKGRGRNTWWAADGALTFSLLLDPSTTGISPTKWPQLSLVTGVAVCDALTSCLEQRAGVPARSGSRPNLQIKWPNDVLLDGCKVCGILIESPGGEAPAKNRLIVGIGININNSWREAPHDIGNGGTALCDFTGGNHDLQATMIRVLNAIAERDDQLRRHDDELFRACQRLNYLAGRSVVVETTGGRIEGNCEEIGEDGALVLNTRAGRQRFYSGSVRLA
jgi:BirA family transcriptional regulator, biotin operon repressor / biotin---[acetyl-CoA-carboxylase] ligase